MLRCTRCNSKVDDDARFCDICGAPLVSPKKQSGSAGKKIAGRDSSCDIVINDETVSKRHAEIEVDGDSIRIKDLGSSNGTFVNGRRLASNESVRLQILDSVRLGFFVLELGSMHKRISDAHIEHHPSVGSKDPRKKIVLGRSPDCDVVVNHPQVSARHVLAIRHEDGFLLEDLSSRNGTFINGRRIKGLTKMTPSDRLSLGSVQVVLNFETLSLTPVNPRGNLEVSVSRLQRYVTTEDGRRKEILAEMSFSLRSGELIGVMGQSGAGKSTLLMALSGFEQPTSGRIEINGESLYANPTLFKSLIGFVPQDDLLHGDLTVQEEIEFSARLRLPDDTTDAEISNRVSALLVELGLSEIAHLRIGTPAEKVISGGQRKRVNLAVELVGEPEIVFLDEPTSGLSSQDALDVVNCLRTLAAAGRTIVMTIHQPSKDIYNCLTKVIYLVKGGRLAFIGDTQDEVFRYFNVGDGNPDSVMKALDGLPPEEWQEKFRKFSSNLIHSTDSPEPSIAVSKSQDRLLRMKNRGEPLRQCFVLVRRYALCKLRDQSNLWFLALQAPLVGLMLAVLFGEGRSDYGVRDIPIFIMGIAVLFFGTFNASREIVRERGIARRERLVFLQTGPYIFSKFLFLSSVSVPQIFVLLLAVKLFVGIDGSFLEYFFLLLLTSLCSIALGLLISTLVKSVEAAMAVVPIVVILQIVLAGFLKPLNDRGQEHVATLAAPFVSRWSTEALMEVERRGLNGPRTQSSDGQKCDVISDSPTAFDWCAFRAQSPRGYLPRRLTFNITVLLGFCIAILAATLGIYRSKNPS